MSNILERLIRKIPAVRQLQESLEVSNRELTASREMLELTEATLEGLNYELRKQGFLKVSEGRSATMEPTWRQAHDAAEVSRLMFLENPLIRQSVEVVKNYVFAQGVEVTAVEQAFKKFVKGFWKNPKNRSVLTGHKARGQKERQLKTDGNVFLLLVTDEKTGVVFLRNLRQEQVIDILVNPDDESEPWFYVREFVGSKNKAKEVLYPDYRYLPEQRPATDQKGREIKWNAPVYHVHDAPFGDWKKGFSETSTAEPWARATSGFMSDLVSQWKSLAKFAWDYKAIGGTPGLQKAFDKLNTNLTLSTSDTNPAPIPGSVFLRRQGSSELKPINTHNTTVKAENGREIKLQVASGTGLPETFFGDVKTGNLATAKTLDRPTELKMLDRQQIWTEVFVDIIGYAITQASIAPSGQLKDLVETTFETPMGKMPVYKTNPDTNEPYTAEVVVKFPPILERDVNNLVNATVTAATLGGKELAGTIPKKVLSARLLNLLGEENIEEIVAVIDDEEPNERQLETEEKVLTTLQDLIKAHEPTDNRA